MFKSGSTKFTEITDDYPSIVSPGGPEASTVAQEASETKAIVQQENPALEPEELARFKEKLKGTKALSRTGDLKLKYKQALEGCRDRPALEAVLDTLKGYYKSIFLSGDFAEENFIALAKCDQLAEVNQTIQNLKQYEINLNQDNLESALLLLIHHKNLDAINSLLPYFSFYNRVLSLDQRVESTADAMFQTTWESTERNRNFIKMLEHENPKLLQQALKQLHVADLFSRALVRDNFNVALAAPENAQKMVDTLTIFFQALRKPQPLFGSPPVDNNYLKNAITLIQMGIQLTDEQNKLLQSMAKTAIEEAKAISWDIIDYLGIVYTPKTDKHPIHSKISAAMKSGELRAILEGLGVTDPTQALQLVYKLLFSDNTKLYGMIEKLFKQTHQEASLSSLRHSDCPERLQELAERLKTKLGEPNYVVPIETRSRWALPWASASASSASVATEDRRATGNNSEITNEHL